MSVDFPAQDSHVSHGSRSKPAFRGPSALLLNAVYDGHEFGLLFGFVSGFNVVLKRYRAQYQKDAKQPFYRYWRVRRSVIDAQGEELFAELAAATGEGSKVSFDGFMATIRKAQAKPNPTAFTAGLRVTLYPLEGAGVVLVSDQPHQGVVSVAKSMGGQYLPPMKAWKMPSATMQGVSYNLQQELLLRDDQIVVLEGQYSILEDALHQAKKPDNVGITLENFTLPEPQGEGAESGENAVYLAVTSPLKKTRFEPAEIASLLSNYELYDYQREGVEHLITKTSALLADDMGLGKSRQAVVAAHILAAGAMVLILCPASLILNWEREVRKVVPDAKIAIQKFNAQAEWFIVNYDRLEDVLPHAHCFRVMIVDEAHSLKESTTQRTRLAFDVAAKVPYRYLLTGTPILNRESELHTLLRLSGHPLGNIPIKEFEAEFAGSPEFRRELHSRISEWMLRRKKETVLRNLRGKQHQMVPLSPLQGVHDAYFNAANDGSLMPLQKVGRLRQILEGMKIDFVMEMLGEMQQDDKALVFCEYTETVYMLRDRLAALGVGCVTMVGADSPKKRQKAEDAFQQDPDIRVFIGTTKAAGVGINLTAANYVIFASLPWTPGLKDQAEDRAYRNGQQRLVIVKIPLMAGTIDEALWTMLQHKSGVANDILDPEAAESMAMKHFAQRLAA